MVFLLRLFLEIFYCHAFSVLFGFHSFLPLSQLLLCWNKALTIPNATLQTSNASQTSKSNSSLSVCVTFLHNLLLQGIHSRIFMWNQLGTYKVCSQAYILYEQELLATLFYFKASVDFVILIWTFDTSRVNATVINMIPETILGMHIFGVENRSHNLS